MARTSPYRDPAGGRRVRELPRLEERDELSGLLMLSAVTGGFAFLTLAVGFSELSWLAGAVALTGSLRSAARLLRRRRWDALESFLGSEVVESPGAWTSRDGRRRVRLSARDGEARWERLDPGTGATLESFRGPAVVSPPPARSGRLLRRLVATPFGRPHHPRCFAGLPREVSGRSPRLLLPAWIVVEVRGGGVLIERRAADGALLGDTWHPDSAAALRQLEGEYGEHIGRLRHELETEVALEAEAGWEDPPRPGLAL